MNSTDEQTRKKGSLLADKLKIKEHDWRANQRQKNLFSEQIRKKNNFTEEQTKKKNSTDEQMR